MKKVFTTIALLGIITPLLTEPVGAMEQLRKNEGGVSGAFLARAFSMIEQKTDSYMIPKNTAAIPPLVCSQEIFDTVAPYFSANMRGLMQKELLLLLKARTIVKTEELSLARDIRNDDLELIAKKCPYLEKLGLWCHSKLTNASFQAFANCTRLKELDVSYTTITDKNIHAIVDNLSWLKELRLLHCSILTTIGFQAIAKLQDLRVLEAEFTSITNADVQIIAEKCQLLEELSLSFCGRITNFQAIAKLQNLRKLDVIYTNIDNADLFTILRSCQRLEELNLNGCQNLSCEFFTVPQGTEGFRRIAALQNLRKLSAGNTTIDDTTVLAIVRNCPKLIELDLHVTNVSDTLIQQLRDRGISVYG